MQEKLLALIFSAFILLGCIQAFYYFYLAWFNSEKYFQQMKNNMIKWKMSSKLMVNFKKSPNYLLSIRLIMTFILLLSIPILVFTLWALLAIWLELPALF